jgi:hypothetical protein
MNCTITDCTDRVRARGLCPRHYGRWQRHGNTNKITRKWLQATKVCNRCQAEKSIGDFYSTNRGTCKRCCSILNTCRKLDITYENYIRFLERQHNTCAVCQKPFDKIPCLDHDHKSGKLRGFVCQGCNILLGVLDKLANHGTINSLLLQAQVYRANPPLAKIW